MKTIGHTEKFIKKITLKGIRNYMTMLKWSFLKAGEPGYQPLHVQREKDARGDEGWKETRGQEGNDEEG